MFATLGKNLYFIRFWSVPSPFHSPLSLLRSYPYWLGTSRFWVVHSWLARPLREESDQGHIVPRVIKVLWFFKLCILIVKFLRGTGGGVGGVCYTLKRHFIPEGFAVVRPSQHGSRYVFFPHPGTSGPNLSLSAYFILSFPSHIRTEPNCSFNFSQKCSLNQSVRNFLVSTNPYSVPWALSTPHRKMR